MAVAACAHEARPVAQVRLPPRPVVLAADSAAAGTLLGECRIVGTGERAHPGDESAPFEVFSSNATRAPALVIASPGAVHLAWSHFPGRPSPQGRARVELGGQAHVRFTGWSELRGRTFTAKRRMYAMPGHLWARAGSPIALSAFEDGSAVAQVETPFVSPKTFTVRGSCEAIAYAPEEPEMNDAPYRPGAPVMVNATVAIDLYESPAGRPFSSIVFEEARGELLEVIEKRPGFVRVTAKEGSVGFDAWVPAAQLGESDGSGVGSGYGSGSSHCGGRGVYERGTVQRDAPLFVGRAPGALAGAVVEKNADVIYFSKEAVTVGTKVLVPFTFFDSWIDAPEGERMWIAKDVIGPKS